jgi:hypothetical protein
VAASTSHSTRLSLSPKRFGLVKVLIKPCVIHISLGSKSSPPAPTFGVTCSVRTTSRWGGVQLPAAATTQLFLARGMQQIGQEPYCAKGLGSAHCGAQPPVLDSYATRAPEPQSGTGLSRKVVNQCTVSPERGGRSTPDTAENVGPPRRRTHQTSLTPI